MKKKLRYCTPQLHKLNDLKNLTCTDGSSADTLTPATCFGGSNPDNASAAACGTGSGAGAGGCLTGRAAALAGTCDTGFDVGFLCSVGTSPDSW